MTSWVKANIYRLCQLLWRALGEDALQGAAMHVEAARGLGDVAITQLIDALDVLPADAIGRHRILGRGRLALASREQRVDHIVGVGGFAEIVDGAELHGR